MASRKQAGSHSIGAFLLRIEGAEPVAHLRAGHGALEFRTPQRRAQKFVLIQQNILVERHVGDANRALVAQCAVVAPNRNFEDRIAMRIQAAMAVVIADCVCGAEIRYPAGFEQRNQPRLMLPRHRHRSGNRQRQRAAEADRFIQDGVNAAQKRASKGGK